MNVRHALPRYVSGIPRAQMRGRQMRRPNIGRRIMMPRTSAAMMKAFEFFSEPCSPSHLTAFAGRMCECATGNLLSLGDAEFFV